MRNYIYLRFKVLMFTSLLEVIAESVELGE